MFIGAEWYRSGDRKRGGIQGTDQREDVFPLYVQRALYIYILKVTRQYSLNKGQIVHKTALIVVHDE